MKSRTTVARAGRPPGTADSACCTRCAHAGAASRSPASPAVLAAGICTAGATGGTPFSRRSCPAQPRLLVRAAGLLVAASRGPRPRDAQGAQDATHEVPAGQRDKGSSNAAT